ncbi:2-amino-4-hydroxy-6-hydroxymethyldihydropteridine diphosphokinase [Corynebacterium yudongzhengii]|uniref:2-amino-4-hydroxy-6-hydroxymethyldihydropteridine diphosphokinase n=1 Tax=Corynebacterium yudongzhengii TaxID=2080740 RepID=A0A2U1T5U9_9CORY|nr:2-amino-4-hydroxy-6-hydroxymethyldihydropteridine diphosphokinase [Corynebacterium yudongzhengii]AWB82645.1 2-amino-4-hydroxy-6-hydroxymethyldihydropteridine diphosphokinase [Corynebacterium yudongzhengii]PWC01391.1 2-amino-4-hydroxy-6-hydroxymethyldihydropteridine diphosphokinase [Corynebacterium yudongzhengii]
MRAVLSIGTNQGDREKLMQSALDYFAADTVASSQVYATPPWGMEDQPDFLNSVIIIETDLEPIELLRRGQRLETRAQRQRNQRWGPRTLDIDIVAVYDEHGTELKITDFNLSIPHRWAQDRAFVLVPWLDADPKATLYGRPLKEYLDELEEEEVAAVVPHVKGSEKH